MGEHILVMLALKGALVIGLAVAPGSYPNEDSCRKVASQLLARQKAKAPATQIVYRCDWQWPQYRI